MKNDDARLREFFEAERVRDAADAPPFHELAPEHRRPGRRWWTLPAVIASAAGLLFVLVLAGTGAFDGDAAGSAPLAELDLDLDLDGACDAALAALEEQEADARLRSSTDTLLDPWIESTD